MLRQVAAGRARGPVSVLRSASYVVGMSSVPFTSARGGGPCWTVPAVILAGIGCGAADSSPLFDSPRSSLAQEGTPPVPSHDAGPPSVDRAASGVDAAALDAGPDVELPPLPHGGPITLECATCAWHECQDKTRSCLSETLCTSYFECFASCAPPCWECFFKSIPSKANDIFKCTDVACPGTCPTVR
jgi:hypothetical protein